MLTTQWPPSTGSSISSGSGSTFSTSKITLANSGDQSMVLPFSDGIVGLTLRSNMTALASTYPMAQTIFLEDGNLNANFLLGTADSQYFKYISCDVEIFQSSSMLTITNYAAYYVAASTGLRANGAYQLGEILIHRVV